MNTAYPTAKQSLNVIGILIVCMMVAAPILMAEDYIGEELTFLIYYIVSMGATLYWLLQFRKKYTTERPFRFEVANTSIIPFIIVGTLGLQFGVVVPIASLVPVPDFFKKVFLDMMDETGLFSFLAIVVAAPIFEELIFRGVILDGLLKRYSPIQSILLSSFLFGFIHFNPWQFIAAAGIGIFAGWIYYRTRSLSLAIIVHMTNNLSAFAMNLVSETTWESMDETLIESYGGWIPMVSITSLGILLSAACVYFLNRSMNADPQSLFADPAEPEVAPVTEENFPLPPRSEN